MRSSTGLAGAAAIACLVLAVPTATGAPGAKAAVDGLPTVMDLQFAEPAGATVAADGSGLGNDATIGGHVRMNGSWADWDRHPPGDQTYHGADHLIMVDDAADHSLDPGSADFTVEFSLRTTDKFGNILQKGQARTAGGQVKFQQPKGFVSCMFKSPTAQASIKAKSATNDGQWHVIRCERTSSEVRLYVDGVLNNRIRKSSGHIDNVKPWTLGGKFDCDTSDPSVGADSCDYFPGDLGYVTMWKG